MLMIRILITVKHRLHGSCKKRWNIEGSKEYVDNRMNREPQAIKRALTNRRGIRMLES
jgi:hypothetical protein